MRSPSKHKQEARQADAILDEITDWLRGHQNLVDLIEAIGYAQADAHKASGVKPAALTYNDHLWCTLDAALTDEGAEGGANVATIVQTARRAAGRKPIPTEQVAKTVEYVTAAIDTATRHAPGMKATALRILAALICPTPEKHPEVLDVAIAITKEAHP